MLKKFVICSLFCLCVFADRHQDIIYGSVEPTEEDFNSLFEHFQKQYQEKDHFIYKQYPHVDRKKVFKESVLRWKKHNSDTNQQWSKGFTKFADMTEDEFVEYAHLDDPLRAAQEACNATAKATLERPTVKAKWDIKDLLPVDWRQLGVVSGVKNQARCGSCWAFAAVGALEAHWTISTRTLPPPDLAEQQLVDCAGDFNNSGCMGGLPSQAFEYIRFNGGINPERAYPYLAEDTGSCRYDSTQNDAYVPGGSFNITSGDEDELEIAVFAEGPVSIGYQVVKGFRDYTNGTYNGTASNDPEERCNKTADYVNHAVVVTGFGKDENNTEFWTIKNSWGENWGNKGYFNMVKGENMCGIATCASFPNMHG